MIGRADIEGSKSNVAMSAWLPQASYPCGNFSDTSTLKCPGAKGSIGRDFSVRIPTENQNQASFCPFAPREISVLAELAFGHLRYSLANVPPQPNSPPGSVGSRGRCDTRSLVLKPALSGTLTHPLSRGVTQVVVFHQRHSCLPPILHPTHTSTTSD